MNKQALVLTVVAALLAGCSTSPQTQSTAPSEAELEAGMNAGVDMAIANIRKNGLTPMTADQCIEQYAADAMQTMNGVTFAPRDLCLRVAQKYYSSPTAQQPASLREQFELTATQESEAKTAVSQRLKDPESARFEELYGSRLKSDHSKWSICGMVNAKNSFGGYTGAKPFMYLPGNGVVFPGEPGSIDSDIVRLGCGGD
ncbi:MAG: hypothetical protein HRU39_01820 [Salinicola sp.]|uniref:hypothetical protein n=1 Tax=Salinicola sp. TaxID=1978524 RepID=UPI001D9C3D70|nr:hypothetical protein [Salinicola sp.]NRB54708.1 hypothetical protein [Salinicola sp.]